MIQNTVGNPSNSSKQKERFWFYEPVHPEADTTGVNSRENVSQKLTSTEQDKEEFFVSHKWDKAIEPKPKRIVKPRKVTNVGSLGQVYNVTGEDESSSADEKNHSTGRKRQLNSNQKTTSTGSATEEEVPTSFEEASKLRVWRDSMKTEVKALQNRGCWRVFRTPAGVRLIKSKFVYKLKKDWTGKIVKRKSRLVVLGCLQREGVDYDETFAPVAKVTTFRLMLALSQVLKLKIHQLDVDSAFPYADLEEEVFMSPPPGMDIPEGFCLKLNKSLYGLKQVPRNWNKNIVEYIKSIGFKQSILDNCLFVKKVGDETYLISLYVDDILVAGSDVNEINKIKQEFMNRYEMKDLGELNHYLGMKVTRTEEYIQVDQTQYIKDMIAKYSYLLDGLEHRHFDTPMERDLKLQKIDIETETAKQRAYALKFPHMNIVGALLYLSINTRPDISYAVGALARFNKFPTYRSCKALIRLLIYVRDTSQRGIQFNGTDFKLYAYSDADWGGDLESRRSTTGYVVYAAGGPIAWQSKLQSTVAVSTMEAEYMAAFGAIQELIWIKGVLGELGFAYVDPITLYIDSTSAIRIKHLWLLAKRALWNRSKKLLQKM